MAFLLAIPDGLLSFFVAVVGRCGRRCFHSLPGSIRCASPSNAGHRIAGVDAESLAPASIRAGSGDAAERWLFFRALPDGVFVGHTR